MFGLFRATPNYDVIHNKVNEYKTMTRGQVADHLKANNFTNQSLKGNTATEIAIGALIMSLAPVLIGLGMGGGFALAGGLDWAKIVWSVCGGITVATLGVAGCAGIVRCYRRSQPLPVNEFNQLMEEIANVKAEDIKILKNRTERSNRTTQDYQSKIDNFEKLNFDTAS